MEKVRGIFTSAEQAASAGVLLPEALDRKLVGASKEWPWFWLFPGKVLTFIPGKGEFRRNHLHESLAQKAVKEAVTLAGISKRASAHTFRHSYATHHLLMGTDIRVVQELMGHEDVKTTMLYTRAARSLFKAPISPLDWQPPGSWVFRMSEWRRGPRPGVA